MKLDALILPHNIGIAHVMRSYLVAKELQKLGYSVKLSYSGEYVDMINDSIRIDGIFEDYNKRDYEESLLNSQRKIIKFPFGNRGRLETIVNNEILLLSEIKPRIVIGDTRIPLFVSSKIRSIPYVSITNGNLTPYYRTFDKESQKIVESYNAVLEKFSDRRRVNNFYEIFIGNLNLVADLPEFMPLRFIPKNMKYVGPILWSYEGMPHWINEIKKKKFEGKKFAYVSMGSTGDPLLFETIFRGLEKVGFGMVASLGRLKDKLEFTDENLYVTDFISPEIMNYCEIVICHGGNSTIYLSLKYGLPLIGIPINPDQIDNMNRTIELKLGVGLYPDCLESDDIAKSIEFMSNSDYKSNVEMFSRKLIDIKGEEIAANLIGEYISSLK